MVTTVNLINLAAPSSLQAGHDERHALPGATTTGSVAGVRRPARVLATTRLKHAPDPVRGRAIQRRLPRSQLEQHSRPPGYGAASGQTSQPRSAKAPLEQSRSRQVRMRTSTRVPRVTRCQRHAAARRQAAQPSERGDRTRSGTRNGGNPWGRTRALRATAGTKMLVEDRLGGTAPCRGGGQGSSPVRTARVTAGQQRGASGAPWCAKMWGRCGLLWLPRAAGVETGWVRRGRPRIAL